MIEGACADVGRPPSGHAAGMIRELDRDEIDEVLRDGLVGRIGCHANGKTYIVPITYAYDGMHVYCHSAEGLKLQMLRESRQVCFEVEELAGLASWRSVIAWGVFEELAGYEAEDALQRLKARVLPQLVAGSEPSARPPTHASETSGREVVVYRIRLGERTGRAEGAPVAS